MRTSRVFLAILSFVLFLPALSFALVPYDDFSGASIDKSKWRQGDFVREIDSANQRLLMKHASPSPAAISGYSYWDANRLSFLDPTSVNSMQVDVTILEANITNQAKTWARLSGLWYNDGTAGGGMIGNIVGEVFLRKDSTGLYAAWEVVKLTNTSGTAGSVLGYGTFTTPISAGTTYTLYVNYDSGVNQFTFKVGSEEKTFGPAGLPTPVGGASAPTRLFGTRVDVDNSASSGYISAGFDNVYKNGDPYEDFSSLVIDQTKWNDYEFTREISAGKLRSKTRSYAASSSFLNNLLELRNPLTIFALQTKVTPISFQNPQGLLQLGGVSGTFYNDGTVGEGFIGDVVGEAYIGGNGASPVAAWRVYKFTNAEGTAIIGLASGVFNTPVTLGNAYTLSFAWDGKRLTLKCENEEAYYTPVTSINQVKIPFKRLRTIIYPDALTNKEATIETLFDDVMTGPMPYEDDFSGAYIDITRWKETELVREIDTGTNKLVLKHASPNPVVATGFPYATFNDLPFPDPDTVNSIQADVAVLQSDVRNYSHTRARLAGRWFNDGSGTPGTDMTGDIVAEVSLWGTSTGLSARWVVARMTNASGSTSTQLGTGVFATPVSIGTSYNLFIDYDSVLNQFTFQIGAEVVTFGPTGLPARVRGPNSPWKSLSTRVQINTDASSAYIAATFDNVYKNGALYDAFSAATIDNTKWNAYEYAREISGGKFRSKVRSSTTSTSTINSSLEFLYPSSINAIQTKVTPLVFSNTEGASLAARIIGRYYNDGTPGGGLIGDIVAQVLIGLSGTDPVGAWGVYKCTDSACNVLEFLSTGTFAKPITLGETYTLFLAWDGSQFTFKIDAEVVSYTPTTSINPPNGPFRLIGTQVFHPTGQEATLEALFDDVMVNPGGPGVVDFDGDRKTDITVWRQSDGYWHIINSKDGSVTSQQWGAPYAPYNDVAVPGDYDGDGKTDYAVWRPGEGYWYIINSKDGSITSQQWGAGYAPYNDKPVPGDYDGDGKTDIAIWRQADGYWYIINSKDGSITSRQWGAPYAPYNDVAVPGDYDGDGKTDIAVWRQSDGYWYIINSKDGSITSQQWGAPYAPYNDVAVPGDYDGDGKTDIAVWRQSDGYWYIINSKDGSITSQQWGAPYAPYNDVAVPGDYDGDGKTDIAVWRQSDGYWYIINSKDGSITATPWGAGYAPYNDEPISQ